MCKHCDDHSDPEAMTLSASIPALLETYEDQLWSLVELEAVQDQLDRKSKEFAASLLAQFRTQHSLSPRQWPWVQTLIDRVKGMEPIYGDFRPILVMFQFAADRIPKGVPRIRLMTNWKDPQAEHEFVRLSFRRDTREIEIHTGGWSGHGQRRFAGWIKDYDKMVPYRSDSMPEAVRTLIQDFSMDPARVARASSALIHACSFCGAALTDDISKALGYGPICAINYDLPHSPQEVKRVAEQGPSLEYAARHGMATGIGG